MHIGQRFVSFRSRAHVFVQVLAVSCDRAASSARSSRKFVVISAPAVLVSMTISGISSFGDITKAMEQQLVGAVADTLDVSRERVQLEPVKSQGRRLLSLPVTFRVLAADDSDISELQQRVTKADFQVID